MSIYIITHKEFHDKPEKGYHTLLAGAYKGRCKADFYDDEGDNISEKNPNYCELTGLYWIWKHVQDDYVGIVHYRRYFSNTFGNRRILTENEITKKLKSYDIIVPFHHTLRTSVRENYCEISGFAKDLDLVYDIIERLYPEYEADFLNVFNGNKIYFFNMLITRKEVFDHYCEWLFSILFELEKEKDLSVYNDYQKRIYGFLAERLFSVYLSHQKYRVFEVGVINKEEVWPIRKRILTGIKRTLLFYFQ